MNMPDDADWKGTSRDRASHMTMANEYTSAAIVYSWPSSTSGAVQMSWEAPACMLVGCMIARDRPKSDTCRRRKPPG